LADDFCQQRDDFLMRVRPKTKIRCGERLCLSARIFQKFAALLSINTALILQHEVCTDCFRAINRSIDVICRNAIRQGLELECLPWCRPIAWLTCRFYRASVLGLTLHASDNTGDMLIAIAALQVLNQARTFVTSVSPIL
jgi:hypothetical protein